MIYITRISLVQFYIILYYINFELKELGIENLFNVGYAVGNTSNEIIINK